MVYLDGDVLATKTFDTTIPYNYPPQLFLGMLVQYNTPLVSVSCCLGPTKPWQPAIYRQFQNNCPISNIVAINALKLVHAIAPFSLLLAWKEGIYICLCDFQHPPCKNISSNLGFAVEKCYARCRVCCS